MQGNRLEDALKSQYTLLRVLKDTEKVQIHVLRHKTLGREIVKRVCGGTSEIYTILRGLAHPHIARVYDVVNLGGGVMVLEEYINGQTVAEVLETGLYHPRGAARVVFALCRALEALHCRGIVHRDIKPENVMIDRDGTVKLIDFDAARLYKPHQSGDTAVLGTVGYAAPEQFGLTQSDERADIHALGVLLNTMLTGQHPAKKLCKGRAAPIVKKCIRANPNGRYQSARALGNRLMGGEWLYV